MRFYERHADGTLKVLKTVTKKTEARKRIDAGRTIYPSVTEVLGFIPNEGLQEWRERKLFDLGYNRKAENYEQASELCWGMARHPDGHEITSRALGTLVHEAIEGWNAGSAPFPEWNKYVRPWVEYCKCNHIQPLEMEKPVCCEETRVAGTIDCIAKRVAQVEVFDYKCRGGSGELKSRKYDKDPIQLAIYADIVKRDYGLDYMPRTNTVIIDADTGETYVHRWTPAKQARDLVRFKRWANMFWEDVLER